MRTAVEIIREARVDWSRLVVVTSALSGVTNLLLETAALAASGNTFGLEPAVEKLRSAHHSIAEALVVDPGRQAQVGGEIDRLAAPSIR
jgi:aspartate kinase